MRLNPVLVALAFLGLAAPADAASAACQLGKLAEMPVAMAGLTPLVSVRINGADAKLAIDTGAFFSMLDPASAARFGLKLSPLPPGLGVRGVNGQADVHFTTAKTFELPGLPPEHADFLVGEHQMAASADGLMGDNVFNSADAEYDFANGVVRYFVEQKCGDAPLAYWSPQGPYGELPIERVPPPSAEIRGRATLNGASILVVFDSGAARSVLTLSAARRAGVRTDGPGVIAAGIGIGVGRRPIQNWLAPFASFDIGGEQVKSTHLRVADIQLDDADMLLGADFFLSHRIFVSRTQSKVYFTYNGGPVFDLGVAAPGLAAQALQPGPAAAPAAQPDPNSDQPTDAAGFSRRGAAFVARHEYDQAIADFTRAAELAPADPKNFYARGVAHVLNRQPFLAMDDLNQALKLKPDDVAALMTRGEIRLAAKDKAGAEADFGAALKIDPGVQLRVATAEMRAGLFEDALGGYDAWIAAHPKTEDLAAPLAGRCRARALLGRDLDKALADCDASLKLIPGEAGALDSRGLVELRQGSFDKAIADYDAALKIEPKNPWPLFGRGLAEQRKGDAPTAPPTSPPPSRSCPPCRNRRRMSA